MGVSAQDLSFDCPDIPGAAPVLAAGRIVMVGELHGTNEMPAEFLRLVCGSLQRGLAVSVGLEMADPNGALAAYMTSKGDAAARQSLIADRHWNGARDGRSSVAWMDMIETLRSMRQRGLRLTVFALVEKSITGGYDQGMATRLRQERAAHPDALILTYTGNIHSMLRTVAPFPAPMGALVSDLGPLSIDLVSDAGESWSCMAGTGCGVTGWPGAPDNGPPHVARPSTRAGVYTLQVNVGRITASPPAVPLPASW